MNLYYNDRFLPNVQYGHGLRNISMVRTVIYCIELWTSFFQVSYIKLADWYLIISFLFIFGVLIEYTIVLYLTELEQKRKKVYDDQKAVNNNNNNNNNKNVRNERYERYPHEKRVSIIPHFVL